MTTTAMTTNSPASWHRDPEDKDQLRWWDGNVWTSATRRVPRRTLGIVALICGIVGMFFGLVPLMCFVSFPLGLTALILGFVAWRGGKGVGIKQGRAGLVTGAPALVLGVVGAVVVMNAVDNFGDSMDCISNANTSAQLDAC